MGTSEKLSKEAIETFTAAHAGWKRDGDALVKTYSFQQYGAGVAFAVHVGFVADKRDHHPDMLISWGKVEVRWTTHDAGGISALDTEMAQQADRVYHS